MMKDNRQDGDYQRKSDEPLLDKNAQTKFQKSPKSAESENFDEKSSNQGERRKIGQRINMISNYISYAISLIEILFIGGAVWGWGFMQYMMEKEYVFYESHCLEDCLAACQPQNLTCVEKCENEPFICEAATSYYNFIFVIFSSISGFSSLLFEPILRYAGFFWTKLAMSVMTTGGAILLAFYNDNNDLIIWAWNLMGFPSVMYIILNINEQAPRFPSISGLTIGLINGLYDASAGIFLTFKFVYDSDAGVSLTTLLIGFACVTSLVWIKLFFFIPYKETDPSLTVFESSVFGQFCNRDKSAAKDEEAVDTKISEPKEKKESIPVMNSILTINYLLANIFFVIMTVRINSFPSWYYPWLKWTFSDLPEDEFNDNVSFCLDMFGYSYYISLFISPLPGILISFIQKCTNGPKANKWGLTSLLGLIVVLSTCISGQMMVKGSPLSNAIIMTIEYSFLRTFFFISRSMYLFEYFPAEHFSALYSLMNVPCGFANFAIDPLYSSLILNGDDWADADFVSVSFGFMIGCAACGYFIVYSLFLICRMPDVGEDEFETQSAGELSRKSSTTDNKKEIEFSSSL